MQHIEEIKDYWNMRANGFSMAVEEELKTESGKKWEEIFRNTITKENAEVLDDGTGAGFFPVILSRLGHKVTAIDYSDEMTAQAAKRFKEAGAEVLVRQMDAQNLETPETYEELTEVGKTLRSAYGLDYAFFISALVNPGVTFSAGFDLPGFDISTSGSHLYQEEGTVKSCLVSDNMKEFLGYLHSSDVKDVFRGGECAVCWDNADYITEANRDAELAAKGFLSAGIPATLRDAGQTLHFSLGMGNAVGDGISITTACQDPDLLIKTLDWCFTEPGINLCNYGIQGISYDMDDSGNAVWSTNVTENPDTTFRMALVNYTMTGLPSIWDEERYWSEIYDEAAYAAVDLWMNADNDKACDLPGAMFYTTEESAVYATKITDVETYANQYILTCITGEADIDATWDEYVEKVWSLGLQDCIDATQNAYERYLSRGQA